MMDDDLKIKPEWSPYAYTWHLDPEKGEQVTFGSGEVVSGDKAFVPPTHVSMCPFAFLFL